VNTFLNALTTISNNWYALVFLSLFPICWLLQYLLIKDLSRDELEELIQDLKANRKETIGVM
jgi:hypothetical protein